jgi:cysteine-rich repeat protein
MKKVFAGFMALSLNLSLGGAAILIPVNVAYAADTTFKSPTANVSNGSGDNWSDPANAYTNGGGYASEVNGERHRFYDFNFSVTPGSTINGIEVNADAWSSDSNGCRLDVDLSWNGGSTWTNEKTQMLSGVETQHSLGGASDNWGRTWSSADFSNSNFRLRIQDADPGNNCTDDAESRVDWLQVKVTYTPDTTAPNTTITDEPNNPTSDNDPDFEYSSNESGSTFECQLDGAGFSPCSASGKSYSNVSIGSHTFQVRATDAAGNTDATPASYTWTVARPDLTVTKTHVGNPYVNGSFQWKLHVENIGNANAKFDKNDEILRDDMPATGVNTYGTPSVTNLSGVTVDGSIDCTQGGSKKENLICKVSNSSGDDVTMAPNSSFDVIVTVNPTSLGTLNNPTANGKCGVDKYYTNDEITEANENNNTCSDSVEVVAAPPVCGNETQEEGEQCDDGNDNNNDACTNQCQAAYCGDAIVNERTEQCDDGNQVNNDSCTNTCTIYVDIPACADGVDNDDDDLVDSLDPGCTNESDDDEADESQPSCEAELSSLVHVSNNSDLHVGSETGDPAVLVDIYLADQDPYGPYPTWATLSGSQWVWSHNPLTNANSATPVTESFFDVFTVVGTPTGGQIEISADNGYKVWVNGTELADDQNASNWATVDTHLIPVNLLVTGSNVVRMDVTNFPLSETAGPADNPAGLLYKLTINKNACVPTPPLVCEPQVNLIKNGGFESPVLGQGTWSIIQDVAQNPSSVLEWLVAWTNPEDGGTLGLEIQNHVAGDPYGPQQHAELDGDHPVTISQDIQTIPGKEYRLSFQYSPRPGTNEADNTLQVKKDGVTLGAQIARGSTSGNTEWTLETRTFIADSATTKIEFVDLGSDTSLGTYLDDVGLYCTGDPVVHTENDEATCNDQVDNDEDQLVDGNDPDCRPSITVTKHVINNNSGTKNAGDFDLHVNVDVCDNLLGMQTSVPDGMYNEAGYCDYYDDFSEEYSFVNTIVDWFSPKVALATALELFAPATFSGNENGTTVYFTEPSDYSVTEDEESGYTATFEGDCVGSITWGQHKTCTVTNNDAGGEGGSGTYDYWGCTNTLATNFNSFANRDDGSCQVPGGAAPEVPQGEVLGAATTEPSLELPAACIAEGPYLRDYMKMGMKNDPEQVKKLQTYLNDKMNAGLPVTGFYGPLTKKAVKEFQKLHHAEIIQPWLDAGFDPKDLKEGTGVVYKTTKRFINITMCSTIQEPMPDLANDPGIQ